MSSVLISMLIGSKFSTKNLVRNSLRTILENIGTDDFLMVIGFTPYICMNIRNIVRKYTRKYNGQILTLKTHCDTFADFTNYVFQEYSAGYKWFLVSHDDVCLNTPDFVPAVDAALVGTNDDVGWISFTDDDYLNGHWAPSIRPGWHLDYLCDSTWNKCKMFQFHNLADRYLRKGRGISYFSGLAYDFPSGPVKCHAPFSHFIMIKAEKLKMLGPCEVWSEVSLLIDEDWGLSALKEGMHNIWIPDIVYTHCRGDFGTRAGPIIKNRAHDVHQSFFKKWGFKHNEIKRKKVNRIGNMHKHTNIPWSIGRNSYDWDYV